MNRWTDLSDPAARAAFADYFTRVDRQLAPLIAEEAGEVRRELEQHALDVMTEGTSADEALERLGDPADFLPDLVAEKLRGRAARSFQPAHIARALAHSATSGLAGFVLSAIAGLGYAIVLLAFTLGVTRLIDPDAAGLYRLAEGGTLLGFGRTPGDVDLLGHWFAPIALAIAIFLYLILTLAFGRVKIRKPRRPRGKK